MAIWQKYGVGLGFMFGVTLACANTQTHGLSDGVQFRDAKHSSWANFSNQSYPLSRADIEKLASSVAWRRLLLFADAPHKKDSSTVTNADFFLAPDGRYNPQAELVALLNAMAARDEATLCRFVARVHFIDEQLRQLGIEIGVHADTCPQFHAWQAQLDARQLSFMFAEENPNNIASAFAHVFIRADTSAKTDETAVAINYTMPSTQDGALKNALKSISGQYDAVLEILPFSQKKEDYLVTDERDMWQYRLDLSEAEVAQIIRHLWEVQQIQRPYFFTHENCATEIVRLIDVVRPQLRLRKKAGKIIIPSQIARLLNEEGLVQQTRFVASNSTKRQARQNQANSALPEQIVANNNNPAYASGVHRVGVGAGFDDGADERKSITLNVRPAYQDFLDNPKGVRQYLQVALLTADVSFSDKRAKLDKGTIFSTTSLNPSNTAKYQTDKGSLAAYQYGLGFERVADASSAMNERHLVFGAHFQKGKSWALSKAATNSSELPNTVCYALTGGGAQVGRINQGYRIAWQNSLGCVHHLSDAWRAQASVELPLFWHYDSAKSNKSAYWQPALHIGMQMDINQQSALRLNAVAEKLNQHNNVQAKLAYLRYF